MWALTHDVGAAQCRPHTTFSFAQFQTQKVHNEPFVWAKSACDTPFDRLTLWNVNRYYHSSACDSVSCIVKTTTANIYANRQIEFMKHQNLMKKPIFCPFVWTYWCILSMGGFFFRAILDRCGKTRQRARVSFCAAWHESTHSCVCVFTAASRTLSVLKMKEFAFELDHIRCLRSEFANKKNKRRRF